MSMSKARILKAIKGSGGIMSAIAKRLGCEWHTANKYCNKYPETKQALLDEDEGLLDLAESTVVKAIQEGDTSSARWILATKGKKRGYGDKLELSGDNENPLVITINRSSKGTPGVKDLGEL